MKRVSIIGAGWLGLDLVGLLVQAGFSVNASYRNTLTQSKIFAQGGEPIFLDLNERGNIPRLFFEDTNTIVILLPPGKVLKYVNSVQDIIKQAEDFGIPKIVFSSSTSVYPDSGVAKEDANLWLGYFPDNDLLAAEKCVIDCKLNHKYVLRLAGLIGPKVWEGSVTAQRNPSNFLSGKTNVPKPKAAVNLVFKDDVLKIILHFIEKNHPSGVFNICSDDHPSRSDYYTKICEKAGVPIPIFANDETKGKIVSNQKIKKLLGFEFLKIW